MNAVSPVAPAIVSATDLQLALSRPNPPCVVDVRFDLADPGAGERAWQDGHIPGACYLHLDRDLCGPTRAPDGHFRGRHPLPERDRFAATLAQAGIGADTPLVIYDAQGGMYAARLWWMLRWVGHHGGAVLDGGLGAWMAAGGTCVDGSGEPGPARAAVATWTAPAARQPTIDADGLQAELGRVMLIDARSADRFRGEVEPLDAAAGHIPGAVNRFFKDNLDADGRFKPAAQLRAEFDALLGPVSPARVVHQCGSGVTACHNLLAMVHAGLEGSALYPGSWSEWSADPARPLARG